ncbi:MAG: DUF4202 family protein [Planctomycetes bacterium]|nr:DUF4202 family protein [Planctomycetota bacterium]
MRDDRFNEAIRLIDAENAQDPSRELEGDIGYPAALLYSMRMTQGLAAFAPGAAEHLKIAARAQHIRRWDRPREMYELDRKGYHLWRTSLYEYHADVTEKILRQVGYDEATIGCVRDLLMKKRIKSDPDMQALEDVICLVFLRYYFDDFAAEHEDAKVITILQRTWNKMSETGHAAAMKLPLSEKAQRLISQALGSGL